MRAATGCVIAKTAALRISLDGMALKKSASLRSAPRSYSPACHWAAGRNCKSAHFATVGQRGEERARGGVSMDRDSIPVGRAAGFIYHQLPPPPTAVAAAPVPPVQPKINKRSSSGTRFTPSSHLYLFIYLFTSFFTRGSNCSQEAQELPE